MTSICKTSMGPIFGLAFAATLTACGPLNENNVANGVLDTVRTRFSGEPATPAPTAPVLTRAQVDANPGSFLVLNAYNGTMISAMAAGARNGNRTTWLSASGPSVTTRNGILVATRGFPRDLMAADVTDVMRALVNGGGSATRTHDTLSDTDQIVTQTFTCTVSSKGRETISILGRQIATEHFDEACQSDRLGFTNSYWIDGSGTMVRTLQAVAPDSGYIQLDRP